MKISNRLFFRITLSAFALIMAFMFLFLRTMASDENERFESKITVYSSMLPRLFASPMYNLDDRMVDYLVSALEVDPEISRIEVKNERGGTILMRTKNASGIPLVSKMDVVHEGVSLGALNIEYSDALVQSRLKQTVFYYLAMLAALLTVLGVIVFWTSFSITRPLYQIVDLVRQISAGEPEGDAKIVVQGELSILLAAVRSMRSELVEREASVLKAKDDVFKHELESTLAKQQLDLEREAHLKTEALRGELQTTLDNLKAAQQQLVMSEKMASLGSLVAGVAHEINTPLGNSLVSASYLSDQSRGFLAMVDSGSINRSQLEDYTRAIQTATELIGTNLHRAAELVRGFKQVSVDQTSDAERVFNLNDYLASIVNSLHHQIKKTPYKITIDCPADISIASYPGAISQIMTNFIMNSLKHGFRDRPEGTILIHARCVEPDSLELTYRDDGYGMDAETLSHHFEPFYTTMRNTGGSGLGVYIVYNLVTQRLKGSIHVESAPEKGIMYIIQFPVQFTDPGACS